MEPAFFDEIVAFLFIDLFIDWFIYLFLISAVFKQESAINHTSG